MAEEEFEGVSEPRAFAGGYAERVLRCRRAGTFLDVIVGTGRGEGIVPLVPKSG